jgi:putative oxygen-independent coproporphyrinogen III oxidase
MAPFGVYVHVPFCARRCDYCAFATWTDRHHLMGAYAGACMTELDAAVAGGMAPATSVFFGGGTPSLLPAELLVAILGRVPVAVGAEVTVECNPDTVNGGLLESYVAAGVTRISLGVQSMVPHVLVGLGRAHDPAAVTRAVRLVDAAGFATFNIDLIFGTVGESDADWATTLEAALALDPPHVSAYALTVEAGTPLGADPARHPDDDVQAARYETTDSVLAAAGLANYEISNWARPGHECRHNLLYWSQGEYRGIGCAAHSHVGGRRWWNLRTPERYIAAVESGASPIAGCVELDEAARRREALQLGLRTRRGIALDALDEAAMAELDPLTGHGLIERHDERVVLTRAGRLLANEVAVRLTA